MLKGNSATLARRTIQSAGNTRARGVSKRSLSSSMAASAVAHGISRCGVVGAGQMGLGIAYVAAKVRSL